MTCGTIAHRQPDSSRFSVEVATVAAKIASTMPCTRGSISASDEWTRLTHAHDMIRIGTMNTAELARCTRCQSEYASSQMLHGSDGMICQSCEADAEAAVAGRRGVIKQMVGSPALALLGTLGLCVPLLNYFMPALCGLGALLSGITSVQLGATGTEADGVSDANKVFLIISGAIGGLWGLGLLGLSLLSWIGLLIN